MGETAPNKPADAWYTSHDQDDNDQYYASNYNKVVFINFHGIESVCNNCHQSFSFKSMLYKHLKATYLPGYLRQSQAPTSLLISLPIQRFKAKLYSISSGLAFKDWSYMIALVTLSPYAMPFQSDSAASYCLNRGCGVTLINKKWLCNHAPDKKILKMAVPLKVRGIGASKHESDKFLSMPIYFLRVDKQK